MKAIKWITIISFISLFLGISNLANAQEQEEPPEIYEIAEKEAKRLDNLIELEDWQFFRVDSTLQYNYTEMKEEIEKFQKAKISNPNLYQEVQDKWLDKTDASYKLIFTENQWKAYLKTGAGKQQKIRAKRKAKAEKATKELRKKLEKLKAK